MDEKGYYQCQSCGEIHRKKIKFNINELYVKFLCPCCKERTSHLWVGDNEEDKWLYMNINIDPSLFNYNKTIQND